MLAHKQKDFFPMHVVTFLMMISFAEKGRERNWWKRRRKQTKKKLYISSVASFNTVFLFSFLLGPSHTDSHEVVRRKQVKRVVGRCYRKDEPALTNNINMMALHAERSLFWIVCITEREKNIVAWFTTHVLILLYYVRLQGAQQQHNLS